MEYKMFIEILLIAVIAVVLYGLTKTTERFLAHRTQPVEKDPRIVDHRSRM
jgi:hypothetical protein